MVSSAPVVALADAPPKAELHLRADTMTVDLGKPGAEETTLGGYVVVTYDRFRLWSDKLTVRRGTSDVELEGAARLGLCPCEDPPVSIGIAGARVSEGGDVVLRLPRFFVGPVPIFALPWLWIRPADRPGLLPPFVSVRGADGLLLGAGARLPWKGDDRRLRSIELRAAGYALGGFVLDARTATPNATGNFVWDRLRRDRFVVDTRGFVRKNDHAPASLAWDVDAIRGARGLVATPELAKAARPFDVGVAETSVLLGDSGRTRVAAAAGIVSRARRGEGEIVWGPTASIATGGALGSRTSFEASALFAALSDKGGATPWGRVEAAIEASPKASPSRVTASLRARARLAAPAADPAPSWDAAADARVTASLPFVKVFPAPLGEAPLVHHVAPLVEARAVASAGAGPFFRTTTPALPEALGLGVLGLSSSLGRAYGGSLDVEARAAFAATPAGAGLLGTVSASGSNDLFEARVELDGSEVVSGRLPAAGGGVSAFAEARIGRAGGPSLSLLAAGRTEDAGTLARSLGPLGAFPNDGTPLVAGRGASLGASATTPLGRAIGASAGASLDARAPTPTLLGARASIRYVHPEGCASLELGGSYRVGRPGVDLWLSLDLVPPLPARAPR